MPLTQKRINDQILWATIDRPKARNAIDFEVMDQLEELVAMLEEEEEIRLFILSGSGSHSFVAGGDLKKFHTIQSEEKAIEMSRKMQDIFNRIEELPCWTIACVNGDAYGGGIELMLAFDFRLAMPETYFGFTQGRFYLVPGWGGLTRLVEKVGRAKALEWCGKSSVITAEEALGLKVIEYILPGNTMEKEVLDWAADLLNNDRRFIHTLKNGASGLSAHKKAALDAEVKPFAKLWVDDEHLRRVEEFMQKK